MIDFDHEHALVFQPVAVTLLHDFTFARVYGLALGADEACVTVDWSPGDPKGERALSQRVDEFARDRLGGWLRAHALVAHEFVGMGRLAFTHACDGLTFDLLWSGHAALAANPAR